MRKRNPIYLVFLAVLGLAAFAVSQVTWAKRPGPFIYDSTIGIQNALNQLDSRSRLAENEFLRQRDEIAALKKQVAAQKDEAAKLTKRVRTLELTQGRKR